MVSETATDEPRAKVSEPVNETESVEAETAKGGPEKKKKLKKWTKLPEDWPPEWREAMDAMGLDFGEGLVKFTQTLDQWDLRTLVDLYYRIQDMRKAMASQENAARKANRKRQLPVSKILVWVLVMLTRLETKVVSKALKNEAVKHPLCRWAMKQVGVAHVLASAFFAYIKVEKAEHVSGVWRYAGQDPTAKWEAHTKPPWNLFLKTLCWRLGDSFVKSHNKAGATYGKLYEARKKYEQARNERGELAAQAAAGAARVKKETEAYKFYIKGVLPPGHIESRARRFAVKRFLSHYWMVGRMLMGLPVTQPYVIAKLGHKHMQDPIGLTPDLLLEIAAAYKRTGESMDGISVTLRKQVEDAAKEAGLSLKLKKKKAAGGERKPSARDSRAAGAL
jgi:hypothetical protein